MANKKKIPSRYALIASMYKAFKLDSYDENLVDAVSALISKLTDKELFEVTQEFSLTVSE
jgi:hypothetical protein